MERTFRDSLDLLRDAIATFLSDCQQDPDSVQADCPAFCQYILGHIGCLETAFNESIQTTHLMARPQQETTHNDLSFTSKTVHIQNKTTNYPISEHESRLLFHTSPIPTRRTFKDDTLFDSDPEPSTIDLDDDTNNDNSGLNSPTMPQGTENVTKNNNHNSTHIAQSTINTIHQVNSHTNMNNPPPNFPHLSSSPLYFPTPPIDDLETLYTAISTLKYKNTQLINTNNTLTQHNKYYKQCYIDLKTDFLNLEHTVARLRQQLAQNLLEKKQYNLDVLQPLQKQCDMYKTLYEDLQLEQYTVPFHVQDHVRNSTQNNKYLQNNAMSDPAQNTLSITQSDLDGLLNTMNLLKLEIRLLRFERDYYQKKNQQFKDTEYTVLSTRCKNFESLVAQLNVKIDSMKHQYSVWYRYVITNYTNLKSLIHQYEQNTSTGNHITIMLNTYKQKYYDLLHNHNKQQLNQQMLLSFLYQYYVKFHAVQDQYRKMLGDTEKALIHNKMYHMAFNNILNMSKMVKEEYLTLVQRYNTLIKYCKYKSYVLYLQTSYNMLFDESTNHKGPTNIVDILSKLDLNTFFSIMKCTHHNLTNRQRINQPNSATNIATIINQDEFYEQQQNLSILTQRHHELEQFCAHLEQKYNDLNIEKQSLLKNVNQLTFENSSLKRSIGSCQHHNHHIMDKVTEHKDASGVDLNETVSQLADQLSEKHQQIVKMKEYVTEFRTKALDKLNQTVHKHRLYKSQAEQFYNALQQRYNHLVKNIVDLWSTTFCRNETAISLNYPQLYQQFLQLYEFVTTGVVDLNVNSSDEVIGNM